MWLQLKAMMLGIWTFLVPFLKMFMTEAGVLMANAALMAVAAVAADNTVMSNDAKRKAAFDMIVKDLATKGVMLGVNVTTSMINGAIEAAVQNRKAG